MTERQPSPEPTSPASQGSGGGGGGGERAGPSDGEVPRGHVRVTVAYLDGTQGTPVYDVSEPLPRLVC